jgi:hypothetical protein
MSMFDPNFAIAAAHGITPRVVSTWHPDLPRTPRVMVPIHLQALAVRAKGGVWADCTFQTPLKTGPERSRLDLLPDPFANLTEPRERGIYLHWALPDGLTRGVVSQNHAKVSFPVVPDRWLVLRLSPSLTSEARRAVQGWVLRAGDEKARHIDLKDWQETGTTEGEVQNPLTALGHGDPAWAAYYDNAIDRFAFYDDLTDIPTGPLAYLVCGWYMQPTHDPLGSEIHSLADFYARMNELGWELGECELQESLRSANRYLQAASLVGLPTLEAANNLSGSAGISSSLDQGFNPGAPFIAGAGAAPAPLDDAGHPVDGFYTTSGAWWPRLTLYHGSVVGIGWPGVGFPGSESGLLPGEVGGPPNPSDIKVTIGNTLTEAVGALVAETNHAPEQARLLEAFTLGALDEFDQADGPARVDAQLHASSFGSLPGGEIEEPIFQPATPTPPTLPVDAGVPDPGIFTRASRSTPSLEVIREAPLRTVTADVPTFNIAERFSESNVQPGRLDAAFDGLAPVIAPPSQPGRVITVKRSVPRRFTPSDPVILLQGAKRSFTNGHDGRFTAAGRPICHLTGFTITELSSTAARVATATTITPVSGEPIRLAVNGDDLLERGVENGSVPPECEDLLRQTVLLDPGSAVAAAKATGAVDPHQVNAQASNFMVEQTAWWATRDPRVDQAPLVAQSGLAGWLPSPIGVSPPLHPWVPLHVDWKVQFMPSANGVQDWSLDEIDYRPKAASLPAANDTASGIIREGRALLTGGIATTIAAGVNKALQQAQSAGGSTALPPNTIGRFNSSFAQFLVAAISALSGQGSSAQPGTGDVGDGDIPAIDRSALADIAETLGNMDILAGALDSFHTRLRGGVPGDGSSLSPGGTPTPFVPMRAGFLRVLRLRLVDCFGQVVDLIGSSDTHLADPRRLIKTPPVKVENREDLIALPPRFTSPARLWFRFMDATGQNREATAEISPICGYLLPNHLDGDLLFYSADGQPLGEVRSQPEAGLVWNLAPGLSSTVGQPPSAVVANPFLAGIAQGLIDRGIAEAAAGSSSKEDALSALLRIIDSTLWSVDPFGHIGDEHLSLLIGHPVAVMRALVRLDVKEPLDASTIKVMKVPLRLGALAHWQDGLLGYFVNDNYHTLYCADAAVKRLAREIGPRRGFLNSINLVSGFYQTFSDDLRVNGPPSTSAVDHPYVSDKDVLEIVANQDLGDMNMSPIAPNQQVMLTMLVEPHCVVHATAGLVPRKEIGMRREWVAAALAKIAPTFRFGPVLVDPRRIRMPVANELNGSWSWDHRADITTWSEDKVINATGDALLQPDPARGQEGWLKLTFKEEQ